jgi:hypothetical protein
VLSNAAGFVLVALVGVCVATLLMWLCAALAGVERVSLRSSVIAATGFGLPLAAALSVMTSTGNAGLGLLLVVAAVAFGLGMIRVAFGTTWGKAALTWFMHVCVWVLISSLMIRLRH